MFVSRCWWFERPTVGEETRPLRQEVILSRIDRPAPGMKSPLAERRRRRRRRRDPRLHIASKPGPTGLAELPRASCLLILVLKSPSKKPGMAWRGRIR